MTNPTRIADGMSSYVVYTVNTITTNPKYSYSQCTVIRRYSDFLWLHDILATDYPYAIIPPMPEKNTMNRFEIDFVESRRASLQSFVREVCTHPLLKESKRLRSFLTADDEKFGEEKAETKQSLREELKGNPMEAGMKLLKMVGSGIGRVGSQVQKTVEKQIGGETPLSKEDEKLARYVEYMNDLSVQVDSLASHAQEYIDLQREYGTNMLDAGVALSLMGQLQQDVVGDAMRSMNDAYGVLSQLWGEKCSREQKAFVDPMRRLLLLLNEVKVTIGRRSLILSNYQDAYNGLKKAKANLKKIVATPGKSAKRAAAEDEIEKYKKRAGKLKKKLNTITEKLNEVLEEFRKQKMSMIRRMVLDLLQVELQYSKQMANVWRNYVPELQKVNMEEAVKTAKELGLASVDENRVRDLGESESESQESSEEEGDSSEEESDSSDEKPKKSKKTAKKSKKEESSEESSEEESSEEESSEESSEEESSDDSSDESSEESEDESSDSDNEAQKGQEGFEKTCQEERKEG